MHDAVFAADSICKRFRERQVLKSASVWARPGRITALFGRNGCGKTTLLRIGAGLLSPDDGSVHFAGRCHSRPRLSTLARAGLFFLPLEDLLPWQRTVRESLEWLEHVSAGNRMASAVERMQLEPWLDDPPYVLSGGERRRADIAAVLTRGPSCLLADEPFQGLAPTGAERVADALRSLACDGCAIILTGHEVRTVIELADDVVFMTAGTTHYLGTPAEAVRDHAFRREYLGAAMRPLDAL